MPVTSRHLEPKGSRAQIDSGILGSVLNERQQLRRRIRQQRRNLSISYRRQAAHRISQNALHVSIVRRSRQAALFFSSDGEVDTAPLIAALRQRQLTILLPVLHPMGHNRLWFYTWTPQIPLTRNRFRIPEPDPRRERRVPAWAVGLCFTPLVAFDFRGNRMGMGGGYYDRTFSSQHTRAGKPRLVGLAYSLQEVETLVNEEWDVPLSGVVTEEGSRLFLRSSGPPEG